MELHTLGVEGGYTQKDVQEVARAFTGWTIANPRQGGGFRFEPRMHDDGEKVVLGHKIKAGGGKKDGEQVLDILASHPSTARFIATKLARRFVADDPPQALVERAAATFRETDGDIREVVRTIVTSPEFFARRGLSRQGQVAVRVRRQRRARDRHRHGQRAAARHGGAQPRHAALRLSAADRLLGQGRGVGQYRRAPQSHELRGVADARRRRGAAIGTRPSPSADRRTSDHRRATRWSASALAGELSDVDGGHRRKSATTSSQALALVLGSPEFQRK